MVRRKTTLFILVVIFVTALSLHHRERLVGYYLYHQWHWLHKGEVNFDKLRIILPERWWVFSKSRNELVCMRLPSGGTNFITAVVTTRDIIPMEGGLPASKPIMAVDGHLLHRLTPIETSSIGENTIHLVTYEATSRSGDTERVYFFWIVPAKKLTISVSDVEPSQKSYCLELVNSILRYSDKVPGTAGTGTDETP